MLDPTPPSLIIFCEVVSTIINSYCVSNSLIDWLLDGQIINPSDAQSCLIYDIAEERNLFPGG